jgi:hypothetical protein
MESHDSIQINQCFLILLIFFHTYAFVSTEVHPLECYLIYWSKPTLAELIIDRETISGSRNCPQIKYWQFQVIIVTASLVTAGVGAS